MVHPNMQFIHKSYVDLNFPPISISTTASMKQASHILSSTVQNSEQSYVAMT